MESKQTYLVACFDKSDCIDMMQEVFLMLNIGDQNKGKFSPCIKTLEIKSEEKEIRFLQNQHICDAASNKLNDQSAYAGIVKSDRYSHFVCFEDKAYYERIYRRILDTFGQNDKEGFITELMKKVGRNDVFKKLPK